jgi:hypothetical protein
MMYAVMSVPSSLAFHEVNSITLVANAHNEEQGSKRRVIEICAGGQEEITGWQWGPLRPAASGCPAVWQPQIHRGNVPLIHRGIA